jgi:hypothetical protein
MWLLVSTGSALVPDVSVSTPEVAELAVPEMKWESLSGKILEWLGPRGSSDSDESGIMGIVKVTGRWRPLRST